MQEPLPKKNMEMIMKTEGPGLIELLYHMETTPFEFLLKPQMVAEGEKTGKIDTKALFFDVVRKISLEEPERSCGEVFDNAGENYLLMVQVMCRFFLYPWFEGRKELLKGVYNLVSEELPFYCRYVHAEKVISNVEKREEFCRLALTACDCRPSGETDIQALERFESVSTVRRTETIRKTLNSIRRIKAIRKKMAEDAAREAANVYGRE